MKNPFFIVLLMFFLTLPHLLSAQRVDKLGIGIEYGEDIFALNNEKPDWRTGLKINLEMRYGSVFALIHNFTLGYAVINNYDTESKAHTIKYGYDFGMRLYLIGDIIFFDSGLQIVGYSTISGKYVIKDELDFDSASDFGVGFFLATGLNIQLDKDLSFLLIGNVSATTAIFSSIFRWDVSTIFQFKI